jgi:predicted RNA-binding protein with PUA-like domain
MPRKYWLMKSEPEDFSIDDLKKVKSGPWDGVRNYQARNFMRDDMKKGDQVLFYHSNAKPPGIVGIAEVCKEGYPDMTAFDKKSKYFDAKSDPEDPRWIHVAVKYVKHFKSMISLDDLKNEKKLESMSVIQKGTRLSITPVMKSEFDHIVKMGMK